MSTQSAQRQIIKIETREHLLSTLAEASELEHNLMCLYLYAVFSLKQSVSEGISEAELEKVKSWRKETMGVAIQEMTHLALVANLTTAVGGTAHFYRPNFPVKAGYYPSDFVVELAPFTLATLEHFIFLERPEEVHIDDAEEFLPEADYTRTALKGRLMAHSGDYETVGQLYDAIKSGLKFLSERLGEKHLFCGSLALQLAPPELELEGLTLINDLASAQDAIKTIIEQGEGARTEAGSHFQKFKVMRAEFNDLLSENPNFVPHRPAARNPVMRKPVETDGRVWVSHPVSALYLDLGNALYSLMLRFLSQLYSMETRDAEAKKVLLEGAFSLMHSVGIAGSLISSMPACESAAGENAGLSFSLNRHFGPIELSSEKRFLSERLEEILSSIQILKSAGSAFNSIESLKKIEKNLNQARDSISGTV